MKKAVAPCGARAFSIGAAFHAVEAGGSHRAASGI
jgi:hypothetical protein